VSSPADLAFLGARLERVVPGSARASALAVSGGRIVAVGTDADVEPLIGPTTVVHRLNGETVLPGFQDAHIHPIYGGLLAFQCNLHGLTDLDAYLAAVAAFAASHPDDEWIEGDGWTYAPFPGGRPRREDLDRVVPDRPVFITAYDGHTAWVNSRALELAGVTADTPDPAGGRIERDPDGTPTGMLSEDAQTLVDKLIPEASDERLDAALLEAQRHLHGLGITAWHDAGVDPPWLPVYIRAAADGRLTARVTAAQQWQPWARDREPDPLPRLLDGRDRARFARMRADTVKFWLDGVFENGTAALLEPYLGADDASSASTRYMYGHAELVDSVTDLERRGFDIHFHAIGDAAVRQGLDTFAASDAARGVARPGDGRRSIAHLELIDAADIPRFAELGVAANIQSLWAHDEPETRTIQVPMIGERRYHARYAFGDLHRAGARLAGGSDWTVTSANPLEEMEVAIRRAYPTSPDDPPWRPDQRLDLDTALAAFTIGAAWVSRLETETGTLEVGKLADLAVLDRDLRSVPDGRLSLARVRMTFVEGTPVFEA
jgi:predicted amidohydrolase YtcJ